MAKIGVLGAGTWGIALTYMLATKGEQVTVWSAIPQELTDLQETRKHKNLPGMTLPTAIRYTPDLAELCADKDVLLFSVPSVFVRSTARRAAPFIKKGQVIVDVAKGMEADSLMTMSEVIHQELATVPGAAEVPVVALSGPTHAEEVALGLPTTIVASCSEMAVAQRMQDVFMCERFRVYTNTDTRGVELAGAMKNVIALAVGMSMGLGCGDNAKAALIARGNAEITRLGLAMGCQPETFAGLAGLGDLVVTCTSQHSRNFRAGVLLGKGESVEQARKDVGMVVEGINALEAAVQLAGKYEVDMPIVQAVNAVINGHLEPKQAIRELMLRDKKAE